MKNIFSSSTEKQKKLKRVEEQYQEKLKEVKLEEMNRISKFLMYGSLALSLVLVITYFLSTCLTNRLGNQWLSMIGVTLLTIFTIFFFINSLSTIHKKNKIMVIIASILLSLFCILQLLIQNHLLDFTKKDYVPNFYKQDITEVVRWAEEREILVIQTYEYSDTIRQYQVIGQDITPGTVVKNIKELKVRVSDGPNLDKKTMIPDMIGWDVDQVMDFVKDHFLTGVSIEFYFNSDVSKDIIYEQRNETEEMKRNSPITLKASLGKKEDLNSIAMKNLVGMSLFQATTWLGRNAIDYTIQYGYSEDYEEGYIIQQNITKGKIIDRDRTLKVVITVARKTGITVVDFSNLSASEITKWATDNRLKIQFSEEYDDTIEQGKVIRSSKLQGDTVEVGDTIDIVLSKGSVHMIHFTTVDDFKRWAEEYEVPYQIDYQFSSSAKAGQLIQASHQAGDIIHNTDTIFLVISQGGTTKIPDFIGKTKSEASTLCQNSNLTCEFIYETSSQTKDMVMKQSMKKDSLVPTNTTITITLSSGK
ncbi:MAG: PASTA domain-containing protein [bacterium]|nr:PASTA domain-containing protein [bacterium]